MELSKKERLQFILQYKILIKLNPDEDSKKHYEYLIKILEEGYAHEYKTLLNDVHEGLSQDQCQEIWNILSMYDAIISPFVYSSMDQSDIDKFDIQFHGFSRNEECVEACYADFIFEDMENFDAVRKFSDTSKLDSVGKSLPIYRKMLKLWESMSKPHWKNISKEQILQLIEIKKSRK